MPTQKIISIPGAAGKLEGVVHLPDVPPRAIAVVAHPLPTMGGTMDNKVVTTLTKAFVELGYATPRFNFRGVGKSAVSYDEGNGETLDATAAAMKVHSSWFTLRAPDTPTWIQSISMRSSKNILKTNAW